ncbi:hypothetical protein [Algoriphagus aquimarinus]|uniref:hypothetical protein n=1 Tax=Algoriphagus aquimarinus TaxID=237018 RepID=UPI0030DBABC3|tara:strand:+ start:49887 stop:50270 length:384 start_codon:yes stop_codon:yes gene_type:complete
MNKFFSKIGIGTVRIELPRFSAIRSSLFGNELRNQYCLYLNELNMEMMELESRKIAFVQEFLRIQNEDIVSGLENLLRRKKVELIDKSLTPMSLNDLNKEIDIALDDSKKGRLISAQDLKAKVKNWK